MLCLCPLPPLLLRQVELEQAATEIASRDEAAEALQRRHATALSELKVVPPPFVATSLCPAATASCALFVYERAIAFSPPVFGVPSV